MYPDDVTDSRSERAEEAADQIAAALARLRGRRGGPPPWASRGEGPGVGSGHPWADHRGRGRHGARATGPGGTPERSGDGPPFGGMPPHFGGPARLRLLEALAAASHPLSVGEIGEAIGVDQPRASRLVQQCVEHGLVRREADPDDARRTRVALTDAGAKLVRGFRGERREAIAAALDGFTEAERAELARLLTKLADAFRG